MLHPSQKGISKTFCVHSFLGMNGKFWHVDFIPFIQNNEWKQDFDLPFVEI